MTGLLKRVIEKILYEPKHSSESYVAYLRKKGCKVGEGVYFFSPRTTVVDDVRLSWISIGAHTKITHGVIILAHDYSPSVMVRTHKEVLLAGGKYTTIGENCFLGMNCIIMPGCKVGNNCIVGSGAVVASDIPDNSVCAGSPAKVIMTLDQFHEKQKSLYLENARRNVRHFQQVHNRLPETKELHGFSFLYLERTQENWDRYFTTYLCHGNDTKDVKAAFFESAPVFDSYEELMDFCLSDGQTGKDEHGEIN